VTMRTWQEREELVEARGAEYRVGVMSEDQFRAYLFAMRCRGEDIRHRMADFTPVLAPKTFEEHRLDTSHEWLRRYHGR